MTVIFSISSWEEFCILKIKLNEYTGDYSSFEVQRATKLAQQTALYRQQQQKISHLQQYIDRFKAKATKAKQAQSRMKALSVWN